VATIPSDSHQLSLLRCLAHCVAPQEGDRATNGGTGNCADDKGNYATNTDTPGQVNSFI
jgi:hypothetical protein